MAWLRPTGSVRSHTRLAIFAGSDEREQAQPGGITQGATEGDQDPLADAVIARERRTLASEPAAVRDLSHGTAELRAANVTGEAALRDLLARLRPHRRPR